MVVTTGGSSTITLALGATLFPLFQRPSSVPKIISMFIDDDIIIYTELPDGRTKSQNAPCGLELEVKGEEERKVGERDR